MKSKSLLYCLKFCILLIFPLLVTTKSLFAQVSLDFAATFGGANDDFCYDSAIDGEGNILMGGEFRGTVDFDRSPGTFNLTSAGDTDGFILKMDSLGNFLWVVQIEGTDYDNVKGIVINDLGEIYVAGKFVAEVDFDPGIGIFNLTATGSDSFLLKLDSEGNFIWANSTDCDVGALEINLDGSIVLTGLFDTYIDFDPGPGVFNLFGPGQVYVQKLDSDGNFIWAVGFGAVTAETAQAISIDIYGNIWITGTYLSTVDFDPGIGVFELTSLAASDFYVLKLAPDGSFVWAGTYGNAAGVDVWCLGLTTDFLGNIFIGGGFYQTIDFDMGPGVANKTSTDAADGYILKIANDGNFIWVKIITGEVQQTVLGLDCDAEGNIYTTGEFNLSADLDPGIGLHTLYCHGTVGAQDVFVQKLDTDGNFLWAIGYGGDNPDQGRAISVDEFGSVFTVGYFSGPCDFDPGSQVDEFSSSGFYDIFFQKIQQTVCADLTLIIDSAKNANCLTPGYASCHAISGIEPYDYSWNTYPVTYDSLVYFPTEGFYDVTVIDANACLKSSKVLISGPGTISDIDMNVNAVYAGFAPGFPSDITVDVYNEGCIPASGNFQLILDQQLIFTGANPTPDGIYGDTLSWNFENVIYDSVHRVPQVFVITPVGTELGDTIHLEVHVNSVGDVDSTNDVKDYNVQVTGSFDPNNKLVYPIGACNENYITHEQKLTYTIQFQNTGTADAVNIFILDTLSIRLNKNTLRIIASSHPMVTEYLPGEIIKFVFNNIYLPDSNSNEPESHGYVIFEIESKPSAPDGAVIENSAAIYFDYNEPIITNYTMHTLIDEIPIYNIEHLYNMCQGEFVTVGENVYTETGIYTDHFITIGGCDSIIISTINVIPTYIGTVYATICEGEFYALGPNIFTVAGDYTVTMDNYLGCDSTVTLFLSVNPSDASSNIAEICYGESLTVGGNVYTVDGIYEDVLINQWGCDSLVTTTLIVRNIDSTNVSTSICSGESYTVGDNIYTSEGIYTDFFTNIFGCDSIIVTDLKIDSVYHEMVAVSICSGETFLFDGIILSVPGIYSSTFESISGCDSTVDLELTVETINVNVITAINSLTAELADATYQWVDCNNNFNNIDGATEQTFLPLTSGNYAVVIEQNNCTDTSECYFLELTGVEENKLKHNISIYPNPATDQLIVSFDFETSTASLNIYNNAGALIYNTDEILSSQISINLNNFAAGIYYIKVNNLDQFTGLIFVKK